ncbi:MAG: PD-(D/E)XK nuclease family protein [Candidatus Promineifilaceae bacterium]
MTEGVILGKAKIADYLICPRRFQLRYEERLSWPVFGQDPHVEESRVLGQQYHHLLQRYFLGIEPDEDTIANPNIRRWWRQFEQVRHSIPEGKARTELTLRVPISSSTLVGRFDLLVDSGSGIHIYDWKTYGRARSEKQLSEDLQSRIYLALAAESGAALGRSIRPDDISLTYWFFTDPPVDVILNYDERQHRENWSYLKSICQDIERRSESEEQWPLTADLKACARCAYQIPCGRVGAGSPASPPDLTEWEEGDEAVSIYPEIP